MVGGADAGLMKDEHGEVCPVNWREGAKTIQGDPIAIRKAGLLCHGQ